MFRASTLLLAFAILFATFTIASAGMIPMLKNDDTGAVIFSDGFEGSTVGQVPSSPWVGSDYQSGYANGCTLATRDLASEGFAAYEGSNYVELYRPNVSGGVRLKGIGTAANSGDGENIRLQIAFRVDGNESSIYATNGAGGTLTAQFGMFGNGDVAIVTPNQQDWDILTQKANVGQWNELVVTHQNGVNAWSVSVNGAPFETRQGFTGMSALAFDGIMLQSDNKVTSGYWDAIPVPEPSALIVLASGLMSLLAYAWRKRK